MREYRKNRTNSNMISFFTQDITFSLCRQHRVGKWIKEVLSKHQNAPGEINIIFCSDDYLLEMNKGFLKHHYYTDVITFDHAAHYMNGKISGDIFISIDTVKANAIEFGVSFEEELLRVIAHGILHLLGFKDDTPENCLLMRQQEDAALLLIPPVNIRRYD